jgi:hypothetical protein
MVIQPKLVIYVPYSWSVIRNTKLKYSTDYILLQYTVYHTYII